MLTVPLLILIEFEPVLAAFLSASIKSLGLTKKLQDVKNNETSSILIWSGAGLSSVEACATLLSPIYIRTCWVGIYLPIIAWLTGIFPSVV